MPPPLAVREWAPPSITESSLHHAVELLARFFLGRVKRWRESGHELCAAMLFACENVRQREQVRFAIENLGDARGEVGVRNADSRLPPLIDHRDGLSDEERIVNPVFVPVVRLRVLRAKPRLNVPNEGLVFV